MSSRLGLVIVLVVAFAAVAAAQGQAPAPATVSSMGEAVIRRPPDRAIITLSTEARGQSPQEALTTAVGVARARAEALAAGVGRSVDRIVRIAEERVAFGGGGPDSLVRAQIAESVAVGGSVPVASGEIEIRMRVVLTAAIK